MTPDFFETGVIVKSSRSGGLKVQSLMRKRILSPEQGQPLIAAANAIIDDIRP